MKKIFLIGSLLLTQSVFASNLIILNKSHQYDLNITYQFCDMDESILPNKLTCSDVKFITVKAKRSPEIKNYETITAEIPPQKQHSTYIYILNANEKDNNGNIIAEVQGHKSESVEPSAIGTAYMDISGVDFHETTLYTFLDNDNSPLLSWIENRSEEIDKK